MARGQEVVLPDDDEPLYWSWLLEQFPEYTYWEIIREPAEVMRLRLQQRAAQHRHEMQGSTGSSSDLVASLDNAGDASGRFAPD